MRRNVPVPPASITLVILVVSISRSSSLEDTASPSRLSQLRTFPSVIVRPHFGIVIAVISVLIGRRSSSGGAPHPSPLPASGARERGGVPLVPPQQGAGGPRQPEGGGR